MLPNPDIMRTRPQSFQF